MKLTRTIAFYLALLVTLLGTAEMIAFAQEQPNDPLFLKPMAFGFYDEHSGNASTRYILARGVITKSTPSEFLSFYKGLSRTEDHIPTDIWFHSPGGDLAAGLEFGRIIRRIRLSTLVGGEYTRFPGTITVVKSSHCFSACAWAFLGGRVRVVAEDYSLGVHQFQTGKNQGTEAGAQLTMAILAAYLDEMRVNRRLLDLAATTSANDITHLTADEARALNVDNAEQSIGQWELKATKAGMIMGWLRQKLPRTDDQASIAILSDFFHGSLLLSVDYTTKHSLRSQEDIKGMFDTMDQKPLLRPGPKFASFDTIPTLPTTAQWRKTGQNTYHIIIPITTRSARLLCGEEYFTLDPDWPNCCMDIAPSMTIPTKGLLAIIAALEKQGPVKPPQRKGKP